MTLQQFSPHFHLFYELLLSFRWLSDCCFCKPITTAVEELKRLKRIQWGGFCGKKMDLGNSLQRHVLRTSSTSQPICICAGGVMGWFGVPPHPETNMAAQKVFTTDATPFNQQGWPRLNGTQPRDLPRMWPTGIRFLFTNSLKTVWSTQAGLMYDRDVRVRG